MTKIPLSVMANENANVHIYPCKGSNFTGKEGEEEGCVQSARNCKMLDEKQFTPFSILYFY